MVMPERSPYPPKRSALPSLTDAEFKSKTARGLVAVSFRADYCGHCKVAAPHIDAEAQKHAAIKTFQMDVAAHPGGADAMNVDAIPTVVFFKDGKEITRTEGSSPADIAKGFSKLSKK